MRKIFTCTYMRVYTFVHLQIMRLWIKVVHTQEVNLHVLIYSRM